MLETNRPYLIPLIERLDLPDGVRGRSNPKSSTGRLDVFTRAITDESYRFDETGELKGSRAALEVRAHDVPFMIEHRQRVCKLTFEPMLAVPDKLYGGEIGSN